MFEAINGIDRRVLLQVILEPQLLVWLEIWFGAGASGKPGRDAWLLPDPVVSSRSENDVRSGG